MDTTIACRPVSPDRDVVGESPVWSVAEQALYWVDIKGPRLRCLHVGSGAVRNWPMPGFAGSVALHREGSVLISLGTGLAIFTLASQTFHFIAAPEAAATARRFNDGRCDPHGRFWVGAMSTVRREASAVLYCLEADGTCRKVLAGVTIPNGLAWSPDGRTMYFADTQGAAIYAFDYDPVEGNATNRRLFASTEDRPGRPDGATVDAEGFLWSAEYDGACITRYAPDGRVDRRIALPVQRPTSCAFGGPRLDVLFVTTASQELSAAELRGQPLAGRVLALDPGVRGLPEPHFAGPVEPSSQQATGTSPARVAGEGDNT
jgi:sugar lactone lactonase YvrE